MWYNFGMYTVSKLTKKQFTVSVPASKSILNRALLLAAFTDGDKLLKCGAFGEDSSALLACLSSLGIACDVCPDGIIVHGRRNVRHACTLDVGSAGTAARFLTAILAFRGGEYEFHASAQMSRRPMEILPLLSSLGVRIEYLGEAEHFPFRMHSDGIRAETASVGTDISTQYASGLLLAAALGENPFRLELKGGRADGSYIGMTAALIRAFGGECAPLGVGSGYAARPISLPIREFQVEPDISGACYFYALSLLCNASVTVKDVHFGSLQGDIRFLELLRDKGVHIRDTSEGIVADGSRLPFYNGFDEHMSDYSDQTMTVAVLAAFAESPSILRGVSHIRSQECDRIKAILDNLNGLGARAFAEEDDIFIEPAPVHPCQITTFGDHRIAMAFALAGLKTGDVTIDNPSCCAKTFPRFFDIIGELTK